MGRSESEATYGKTNCRGREPLINRLHQQATEQRSTKSELLEVCSQWLREGWNPHCDSVVSGSQEDQRCLSAPELPGIRAGKPAANTEPRSGLSPRGCHKLIRGTAGPLLFEQRKLGRLSFPLSPHPREELRRSPLREAIESGDSKRALCQRQKCSVPGQVSAECGQRPGRQE